MKYSLVYNSENHNILMSSVVGMGIDSPSLPLIVDSPDFLFSGWVVPKVAGAKCKWLLNYNNFQIELALNIDRPDVFLHLSEGGLVIDSECGFRSAVLLVGLKNIALSIQDIEYPFLTVKEYTEVIVPPVNNFINEDALLWLKMHSGLSLSEDDKNIDFESISDAFKVISIEDYVASLPNERSDLQDVLSRLKKIFDPLWPLDAVKTFFERGFLTIQGIASDEDLVCKYSINVHYVNFIYFESHEESLYIVQYCRNVAIIFPKMLLAVSIYSNTDWVNEPLSRMPYFARYLREYVLKYSLFKIDKNKSAKFLGFNVSQPRPYHYFYDYLYGLWYLRSSGVTNFDIYSVKRCDFWSNFEGVCHSYHQFDDGELNHHVLSLNGFLIMPCIEYSRTRDAKIFERCADFLLSRTAEVCREMSESTLNNVQGLVLWIGVSSEKRSWIEQVDGFSNIFSMLNKKFSDITVLVDGRTFPSSPSPSDLNNKVRDDKIFDELVGRNSSINFINMIGMSAIEKINLAQRIDFFICSYGTDSIYPSAICKKPGVVYVAPSIGDQKFVHIHHNIIEIPSEKIKEVLPIDSNKKSWHETSISMDWRDVYGCVLQLIKDYGIKK